MDEVIAACRAALDRPGRVLALTGAGVSAESGIPTFRGKDGYWTVGSTEYHPEELATQLALNLTTSALVLKHALRRMNAEGGGRVVLTASRAAFQTKGVGFSYSASKLAVVHLVEMAAAEVAGSGTTVNAVSPTIIDTPANRRAMPDAHHDAWPTPAELAPAYLFLASPEAGRVNGSVLSV